MTTIFAAALSEHPGLLETIGYQVNGLIVVFVVLGLIWALLELLGIYFKRAQRAAIATASTGATVEPSPSATAFGAAPVDGLPPELVAAIVAAVHVMCGARARIEAIVPVAPALDWAQEGRRQIFASHQIR